MNKREEKEPCKEQDSKSRFEYIKHTSSGVCDYLKQNKFTSTADELEVFIRLLREELRFRMRF